MSFAVPASRALGGGLRAGDRIDVLATYDGPDGPYTTVVVRAIRVLGVAEGGDGIGGAGRVVTVELPDLGLAQRLAHALDSADVFLLRSGSSDEDTPADYQPEGGVVAPPPADPQGQPVPSDATADQPADGADQP
jgi:Flp pilus assembly protein CpaB